MEKLTDEQYELLLLDLSYRVTTNTFVQFGKDKVFGDLCNTIQLLSIKNLRRILINAQYSYVRPYLRKLSSMTDKERFEWADLFNLELEKLNEIDDEDKAEELAPYYFAKSHQVSIDWLLSHHFDIRGLIDLGLALEAPKEMYQYDS